MKKIVPVIITILLIIGVAAAGIATFLIQRNSPSKERMDGYAYFGITDDTQVSVMVDGVVSGTFGKKVDDRYYIGYDTVAKLINKRFYWDRNENKILYALPNEVVEIAIEDGSGNCFLEDGQLYLSVELLTLYTDMYYSAYEAPNRVVVYHGGMSNRLVTVEEDTQVRYRGGIKSDVLTDVAMEVQLKVLDDSFENWTKVATPDGYIGYVHNESISDAGDVTYATTGVVPDYTSITRGHKINMVWFQTISVLGNDSLEPMLANTTGINVVAPTWFFINDTAGNLVNNSSQAHVDMLHGRGIEVWAVLNDFDGGIASFDETLAVLSNTAARKNIIDTMMASVIAYGIDGINVDIEKVSAECGPHYLQFLRELSVSCRNNGVVLSVDNYVPKDYSSHYDRKEQGIIADYVVIMGYDEHFAGSEVAGSVASLPFVEDGIVRTLQEVPAEKVINGIPFYTRIWNTDSSGRVTSEACGMNTADSALQNLGIQVAWNEASGQNYGELNSEKGLYQVWMEDEQSVAAKMNLIKNYNLAGVASWKLGFERPGVWQIIQSYLQ